MYLFNSKELKEFIIKETAAWNYLPNILGKIEGVT